MKVVLPFFVFTFESLFVVRNRLAFIAAKSLIELTARVQFLALLAELQILKTPLYHMGCKIYISKKGFLVYRLFWNKQTSWEGTSLADTPENRKLVEADAIRIAREIKAGNFDYLKWFPAGSKARQLMVERTGTPQTAPTVRQYYNAWILQKRPPLVRKSQERDYRQHFNRHILPRFGEVEFKDITPRRLLEFRDFLLNEAPRVRKGPRGLSLKTCRNIIDSSFRALVRDARQIDNLVDRDPFESVTWPRRDTRQQDPFTEPNEI